MRTYSHILLFVVFVMSSCVTRVDAPQEGLAQLHIELEMLRNKELIATLKTSNNLSGAFPIEHPEDARITIRDKETDFSAEFIWEADRGVYAYTFPINHPLFSSNKTIKLTAFIEGRELPVLEAVTIVPKAGEVVEQESLDAIAKIDGVSGEKYWERKFKFNLVRLIPNTGIHYQLLLKEQLSELTIVGQDSTYEKITPFPTKLEILEITHGGEAIREFYHQEGLFIKLEDLESEFIEVLVKSTQPITSDNVVTEFIATNLISITEDSYDYHRGLHNINLSENSIFGESALYRSNIKNGLGIFSACVQDEEDFKIK